MTWPNHGGAAISETGGNRVRDVRTAITQNGTGTLQFARYDKTTGAFVADIAGATGTSPLSYTLTVADQPYTVHAYALIYMPGGIFLPTEFNVPIAATNVIATPNVGGGAITLSYTTPADTAPSNGGSTITGLTAVDSRTGTMYTLTGSPFTISGLNNGDGRMFTVYVNNAIGASAGARSNYVVPAPLAALQVPVLLDSFDGPLANYVFAANSTQALETTGQVQGTGRVRMTGTGNGTATTLTCTRTLASVPDPLTLDVLAYCGSKTEASLTTGTSLTLSRGAPTNTVGQSDSAIKFTVGNHWLSFNISDFPAFNVLGAGTMTVKESIQQVSPYTVPADGTMDALYSNCRGRAIEALCFDDASDSQYYTVFPMLEARGLKATFYIPVNFIGQPGKLTWAMLREMNAAGHCIALNTPDDTLITTGFSSDAALTSAMQAAAVTLLANVPGAHVFSMALSNGAFSTPRLAALRAAGIRTARTVNPDVLYVRAGWGDMAMTYPSQGGGAAISAATMIAEYTLAKKLGSLGSVHLHAIVTANAVGTDTLLDRFTQLIDSMQADVLSGASVNYTIDVIDALVSTYSTSNFGQ